MLRNKYSWLVPFNIRYKIGRWFTLNIVKYLVPYLIFSLNSAWILHCLSRVLMQVNHFGKCVISFRIVFERVDIFSKLSNLVSKFRKSDSMCHPVDLRLLLLVAFLLYHGKTWGPALSSASVCKEDPWNHTGSFLGGPLFIGRWLRALGIHPYWAEGNWRQNLGEIPGSVTEAATYNLWKPQRAPAFLLNILSLTSFSQVNKGQGWSCLACL